MKTFILTFILILALTHVYSQNANLIQSSYALEAAANYSAAIDIMKNLLSKEPNDAFFNLRMGWLYYSSGNYSEGLKFYQKSAILTSTLDAQLGILNCYLAQGSWSETISSAGELLKSCPNNVLVLHKMGYAHYMKKDYKTAASYYQRIININAYDFDARGYLLAAHYYANDRIEAKKQYLLLKKYYPASQFVTDFSSVME